MCMRTTLHIDDELLMLASRYTGIAEKTTLVRMGLEALVQRGATMQLSKLNGTEACEGREAAKNCCEMTVLVDTSIALRMAFSRVQRYAFSSRHDVN